MSSIRRGKAIACVPLSVLTSYRRQCSGRRRGSGPAIDGVTQMDRPFAVDIVVRHDVLDAQIAGFRTIAKRFWNPPGNRVRLFAEDGAVTFRNVRIRPLVEAYTAYPELPR